MKFQAKLGIKFYIATVLLLALVIFGWYGIWFLNANEILMEDNTPMTAEVKCVFSIAMGLIVLSWTLSLLTMIRQIVLGCAFQLDENGITSTATFIMVLAFIVVVPVRRIPFSAITQVSEEKGITTLHLDRSKLEVCALCRWLVNREYHLFAGYVTKLQECQQQFGKFYKKATHQQ